MFSNLSMLYALYVLEGKWDINNVPAMIRPQVEQIMADILGKQEEETPEESVEG